MLSSVKMLFSHLLCFTHRIDIKQMINFRHKNWLSYVTLKWHWILIRTWIFELFYYAHEHAQHTKKNWTPLNMGKTSNKEEFLGKQHTLYVYAYINLHIFIQSFIVSKKCPEYKLRSQRPKTHTQTHAAGEYVRWETCRNHFFKYILLLLLLPKNVSKLLWKVQAWTLILCN